MKVLFLANIPSPYRVDFFSELGKLCELKVLYERNNALNRDVKWISSNCVNFESEVLDGVKIGNDSALCFSVIRELRVNKYDFVIIGGYSSPTSLLAIEFLKLLKIPFILNIDGGSIKPEKKIMFYIKKRFISSASAWLSSGPYSDKYLDYYGANENKIYHYPFTSLLKKHLTNNKISLNEKIKLKENNGVKEEKVILSVGRIIPEKGFDTLLKASELIEKDVGIYIIGGQPTDDLLKLQKKYNLKNVHFLDFKTKAELSEYYRLADLFVLPTRGDVWGLVINEAMAHGLPIITTDKCVAGLELVEEGKNGFIFPVDDYEKLSYLINEVIYNDDFLQKAGEENIIKISKYTIENMAMRHMEIFEELNKCPKIKS